MPHPNCKKLPAYSPPAVSDAEKAEGAKYVGFYTRAASLPTDAKLLINHIIEVDRKRRADAELRAAVLATWKVLKEGQKPSSELYRFASRQLGDRVEKRIAKALKGLNVSAHCAQATASGSARSESKAGSKKRRSSDAAPPGKRITILGCQQVIVQTRERLDSWWARCLQEVQVTTAADRETVNGRVMSFGSRAQRTLMEMTQRLVVPLLRAYCQNRTFPDNALQAALAKTPKLVLPATFEANWDLNRFATLLLKLPSNDDVWSLIPAARKSIKVIANTRNGQSHLTFIMETIIDDVLLGASLAFAHEVVDKMKGNAYNDRMAELEAVFRKYTTAPVVIKDDKEPCQTPLAGAQVPSEVPAAISSSVGALVDYESD